MDYGAILEEAILNTSSYQLLSNGSLEIVWSLNSLISNRDALRHRIFI